MEPFWPDVRCGDPPQARRLYAISTHWKWHLDEVYVRINGEMRYLWRAVDHKGEVLESYVTTTRDKDAALTFIKKAMRRHGKAKAITTDGLRSYKAAMKEIGAQDLQEVGRWANNRAENSHQPFRRRERAMLRFRGRLGDCLGQCFRRRASARWRVLVQGLGYVLVGLSHCRQSCAR